MKNFTKRVAAGAVLTVGGIVVPALAGVVDASASSAAIAVAPEHGPNTNGCTLSPDSGPTFNFHNACDSHDLCYHNKPYGNSSAGRKACDDKFLSNMRASCASRYDAWYEAPLKANCRGFANIYYNAVRTFGGAFF